VALLAAAHLRERFGPARAVGLLLGFAGTLLVVSRGQLSTAALALPATRGDLMILASTLNWAVYSVLGRATLRSLGALRATTGAMLASAALLAPVFAATGAWRDYAALGPYAWLAVAFLGVCCSGLGYLWYYGALERIEAAQVAALLNLEPVVTLLAAVAILGEPVTPLTVVGGAVILAGVALVQR
jgi:drug/metabolite transporter (DMT)-like permease